MKRLSHPFFFLRPILAALIIFIPLYPKFPLASIAGTYVAIRIDDVVITASLLFWLIHETRHRLPSLKVKITPLFITYFIAISLSSLHALLITQSEPPHIVALHLLRRLEYMSLFFLTYSTLKNSRQYTFVLIAFIISLVGISVYGYGQKYLRFPIVSTMNSEFSKGQLLEMDVWTRISSTFAGHYDFATFLSVALIIIGGFTITQKNVFLKFLGIIFWLNLFNLLNLTASRVSNFALLGGMSLTIILLRKYLWLIPFFAIFAFSILTSKDLNQRLLATIPSLQNQFFPKPTMTPSPPLPTIAPSVAPTAVIPQPTLKPIPPIPTIFRHGPEDEFIPIDSDVGVARSGEIRFNVEWPRAITAFKKNPLLGTGLGSISLATDNDYLRLLGESGVLGFLTLASIFLYLTYLSLRVIFSKSRLPYRSIVIICLGCLVTFLANATLIDVFEASKTAYLFWILMGTYYHFLALSLSHHE